MNRIGGRRVKSQCFLERFAGAIKDPRIPPQPAERGVTDSNLVIRLDRIQRSGPKLLLGFSRQRKTKHALHCMGHPELAPGKRELRFDLDRRLELVDGGADSVPGKPIEMRNADSVSLDGARVDRADRLVD